MKKARHFTMTGNAVCGADQFTAIFFVADCRASLFRGSSRCNTPFSYLASILSLFTASGKLKDRLKDE